MERVTISSDGETIVGLKSKTSRERIEFIKLRKIPPDKNIHNLK